MAKPEVLSPGRIPYFEKNIYFSCSFLGITQFSLYFHTTPLLFQTPGSAPEVSNLIRQKELFCGGRG
jgi:hypothetical protein